MPLLYLAIPPTATAGTPDALIDFLAKFDFDEDAPKIFATDATFTESGMELIAPPEVADPKLADFKAAGGKLIIFQGASDGIFSVNDITQWSWGRWMPITVGMPVTLSASLSSLG
ncbi:MAG: hypothetical protein R3E79_44510 [Caldilineaceae bacterium]